MRFLASFAFSAVNWFLIAIGAFVDQSLTRI